MTSTMRNGRGGRRSSMVAAASERPASAAADRTSSEVTGPEVHVPSSGFGSAPGPPVADGVGVGSPVGDQFLVRSLGDGHGDRRDGGRGDQGGGGAAAYDALAPASCGQA